MNPIQFITVLPGLMIIKSLMKTKHKICVSILTSNYNNITWNKEIKRFSYYETMKKESILFASNSQITSHLYKAIGQSLFIVFNFPIGVYF